jgi:hypothetical protein
VYCYLSDYKFISAGETFCSLTLFVNVDSMHILTNRIKKMGGLLLTKTTT